MEHVLQDQEVHRTTDLLQDHQEAHTTDQVLEAVQAHHDHQVVIHHATTVQAVVENKTLKK